MNLKEQLSEDMKAAMRAREEVRLSAIRMLRAAIKNKEIEVGHELADDEILRVIQGMVKQRRDSIEAFEKGGRQDLVDREAREIGTLEAYLPPAASEADVERAVREAIAATGAAGPKDMGAVMKEAMKRLGGAADGKRVNEAARRLLA
jgi:uncharacterized protein YqeY